MCSYFSVQAPLWNSNRRPRYGRSIVTQQKNSVIWSLTPRAIMARSLPTMSTQRLPHYRLYTSPTPACQRGFKPVTPKSPVPCLHHLPNSHRHKQEDSLQCCILGCTSGGVRVPCTYSHARRVAVGHPGLCCRVCVTSFER